MNEQPSLPNPQAINPLWLERVKGSKNRINDNFHPCRFIPFTKKHNLKFFQQSKKSRNFFNNNDQTYERLLKDALFDQPSTKLLHFRKTIQKNDELLVEYQCKNLCKNSAQKKLATKNIRNLVVKILDSPGIFPEFSSNLMDWSCKNFLAIALEHKVYYINQKTSKIYEGYECSMHDYITSLKWSFDSCSLIIGLDNGWTIIWDIMQEKVTRTIINSNNTKVISLSNYSNLIASGYANGSVILNDLKMKNNVTKCKEHCDIVSGLKFSPNGMKISSSSFDKTINIWDKRSFNKPLHVLDRHTGPVKALDWHPFANNRFVSGGIKDNSIKIWDTCSGKLVNCFDVGSSVSSVLWSSDGKELINSYLESKYFLSIWNYSNTLNMLNAEKQQPYDKDKVLATALSPCGNLVALLLSSECIMIRQIFEPIKKCKNSEESLIPFSAMGTLR